MPPSDLAHPPRNPLVDANILYEYLLWRFLSSRRLPVEEELFNYLTSLHLRDALRWYLEFAKPVRTSPHVIAEVHGLLQSRARWHGSKLSDFWGFTQGELTRLGTLEEFQPIVKMNRDDLRSFFSDGQLIA